MLWPDETGVFNPSGPLNVGCTTGISAHNHVTCLFAAEHRCAVVWVAAMQPSLDCPPHFVPYPLCSTCPLLVSKTMPTLVLHGRTLQGQQPPCVCKCSDPALGPSSAGGDILGEVSAKCTHKMPRSWLVLLQVVISFYTDPAFFGSYDKGSQGENGSDL